MVGPMGAGPFFVAVSLELEPTYMVGSMGAGYLIWQVQWEMGHLVWHAV